MNFTHLLAFLEVARAGSVTRGAEKLCISQPAVTREIKDLEAWLGATLFDRHSRGVIPTRAGSILLHYAETIFCLASDAQREVRQLSDSPNLSIKIGATESIAAYLAPMIIHELQRRLPDLGVEISLGHATETALATRKGDTSFAIVDEEIDRSELTSEVIGEDMIVAVTAPGNPLLGKKITPVDLVDRVLFMTEIDSDLDRTIKSTYSEIGLNINPKFRLNSQEGIKRLLLMQGGVAYLSLMAVLEEVRCGKLLVLQVPGISIRRPITLVRRLGSSPDKSFELLSRIARRALIDMQPWSHDAEEDDKKIPPFPTIDPAVA